MAMSDWANQRDQCERDAARARPGIVAHYVGAAVVPVTSADDLIGSWEMRFGGPVGSDRVRWTYTFVADGTVLIANQVQKWRLNGDGTLSLDVTVPPDPTHPALVDGATAEERRFAWRAADGRIVLTNDDTSVIQLLTKVKAPSR